MGTHSTQIITLANSIIGVGILAMPYCFEKCGIILSILLLIMSNLITRFSCYYLLKSSNLTRRKNFEHLGFHAFGSSGKLLVELCVIGYLIGTCITYYVVVGDLGPQIISKLFGMSETPSLRYWVMIILTIICIIPLAMLKNVDSLASVCTASIGFYICLVLKVISESSTHITTEFHMSKLEFWRPSGVLQCLPIFSMALSCQMQIFEVYETMGGASERESRMNEVIKHATNICTSVYIFIGFFGYVAFSNQNLSGNIIMNFTPSFVSDIIKTGFVLSVACSFPLAIFPCRVSLYSLIYKRNFSESIYIPESKFRPLTIFIVLTSLGLGILIPSIELVIGLVGSTIGVAICIIFPAACFVRISQKETSEKFVAQMMIVFGLILMVLGTYANLHAIDKVKSRHEIEIKNYINPTEADIESIEITFKKIDAVDNVVEIKLDEKKTFKNNDKANFEIKVDKAKPNPLPVEQVQIVVPSPEESKSKTEAELNSEMEIPKPETNVKEIPLVEKKDDAKEVINNDAILKEDHEIAVEEDERLSAVENSNGKKNSEGDNVKETLEQQVQDIKKELVKQNQETQKLFLKKMEEIVEKVDQIQNKNDFIAGGNKSNVVADVKLPLKSMDIKNISPENKNDVVTNNNKMDPIVKLLTENAKNNYANKSNYDVDKKRTEDINEKNNDDSMKIDSLDKSHKEFKKMDDNEIIKDNTNVEQKIDNSSNDQNNLGNNESNLQLEKKENTEDEGLALEKLNAERLGKEKLEAERLEKEKLEVERQENEKIEAELLEKKRIEEEKVKAEADRIEKKRLEDEKQKLEEAAEKLRKEKLELERLQKEKIEKERLEFEKLSMKRDILQINIDPSETESTHNLERQKRNLKDEDCSNDVLKDPYQKLLQNNGIDYIKDDIRSLPLYDLKSLRKR